MPVLAQFSVVSTCTGSGYGRMVLDCSSLAPDSQITNTVNESGG